MKDPVENLSLFVFPGFKYLCTNFEFKNIERSEGTSPC